VAAEVIQRTKASLVKENVSFVTRESCGKKRVHGWQIDHKIASVYIDIFPSSIILTTV
jgi:hypothetical protein